MSTLTPEELAAVIEQRAKAHFSANPSAMFSPFILGFICDCVCMGVVLGQFSVWLQGAFATDRKVDRVLAIWLVVMSAATNVYLLAFICNLFVYNYGRYSQFLGRDWISLVYIFSALSRIPACGFFAERAWRMVGKNKMVASVFITCFVSSMSGAVAAKMTHANPTLSVKLMYIWLGGELACDLITMTIITTYLWRSRTGWTATDRIIRRLLVTVAETQIPPTIFAVAFLLAVIFRGTSTTMFFFMFSPKIHVICLFAVLNARAEYRNGVMKASDGSVNASAPNRRSMRPSFAAGELSETQSGVQDGVQVRTETRIVVGQHHAAEEVVSPNGRTRFVYGDTTKSGSVEDVDQKFQVNVCGEDTTNENWKNAAQRRPAMLRPSTHAFYEDPLRSPSSSGSAQPSPIIMQ